ncbi:MAG TPA: PAS domain S-box protein [Lacunisphaera sp.]|nr:PAS domain S-box protein [Lacunisphaera sp.]
MNPPSALPNASARPGRLTERWIQSSCAFLIIGLAVGNLFWWWAIATRRYMPDLLVPAAPLTSMCLLLLGLAVGVREWFGQAAWGRRVALGLDGIVILAATHVLVAAARSAHPRWESWLGPVDMTVHGVQFAHMVVYSAALLIVCGTCFAALFVPNFARSWVSNLSVAVTSVGTVVALFLTLSYATGNPLVAGGGSAIVTPSTVIGILLFNVALFLNSTSARWVRLRVFGDSDEIARFSRDERFVLLVVVIAGCALTVGGVLLLTQQARHQRAQMLEQLENLTGVKVQQVADWRRQRLGDARAILQTPLLAEMMHAIVTGHAADAARADLVEWFQRLELSYGYAAIALADGALRPVLAHPGDTTIPEGARRFPLSYFRESADVVELPPFVDAAGELRWDLLVPLRRRGDATPFGAIVLQTNPNRYLLPIVRSWPASSQTGQCMLWYHDDDRLVSLGGYRSLPNTVPAELRPMGVSHDLAALQAQSILARALNNERAAGEDLDDRGMVVLRVVRLVPNSSWVISSRVDASEVYAPLRRSALAMIGGVLGLLTLAGLATGGLWRQRQKNLMAARMTAELEQRRLAARLGTVMQSANDIILVFDEQFRIVDANQQALKTYGWSGEELQGMKARDLRTVETIAQFEEAATRARAADGTTYETVHRRKDGSTLPVEVSARRVEFEGRVQWLAIIRDISERKRAEAALRKSEELYRLIAENTSDIIWLADLRTRTYTYVSASVRHALGWRPDEVVGKPVGGLTDSEGFYKEDLDARMAAFDAGDMSRSVHLYQWELRHKDGSVRQAEIQTTILRDATGRAAILLGVSRDVTERKRAEAALRESEERYRLIAENTSDVIWLVDLQTCAYVYVSPSVERALGWRAEEVVGCKLGDFRSEGSWRLQSDIETRIAAFRAGDVSKRHNRYDTEFVRKDGSMLSAEVLSTILTDASGQATLLLGVTRDITERKKAQEALERFNLELEDKVETRTAELAARNRETEALIASIPDTVVVCDEHGAVLATHFPKKRATVSPFADMGENHELAEYNPLVLGIAQEMHTLAWASRQPVVMEFDRKIDARVVSIEARATPAGDNRLLVLLRDISTRKRLERGVLANLEREKQLSGLKSQFLSVASHEFRTPLAAAVGSMELLERHWTRVTEAKRVELLARIRGSLERLTTIMNDVLKLSRADSGRIKVQRMQVDLVRFVRDIIQEVETGDRQQHRFVFAPAEGVGALPIDTNLLHHIASNLIGNAVRYSPAGTTVKVTLEIAEQDFTLLVADEGIGIPEAEREHIFEPFVRGSNVGNIGGTGLGLNIVKRYTEMMGGRIEVLPVAAGATFRVRIPFTQPSS